MLKYLFKVYLRCLTFRWAWAFALCRLALRLGPRVGPEVNILYDVNVNIFGLILLRYTVYVGILYQIMEQQQSIHADSCVLDLYS